MRRSAMYAWQQRRTNAHSKVEVFISRGFKHWNKTTKTLRTHEYSDCRKDYRNLTNLSETNQNVDESFDEASVNEKLKKRQILVTILKNIQFFV